MLSHNLIRQKFNLRARRLAAIEFIYQEVATRMVSRLDYIKLNPARILDLGSGLNIDANLLAAKYPKTVLYQLDFALNVLQLSNLQSSWKKFIQHILAKYQSSLKICADAINLPIAANSIDILWSNLMLPYINDVELLFKEIRRVLAVGGCFLISGLGVDSLKELREIGLNTYNFPDMHLIGDLLVKLGFTNPVMDMEYITLEYDDFNLLLQDIRLLGIGSACSLQPQDLTRVEYNNLADKFAKTTKNGKIPLTLEVFYAHAWKDKIHLDLPIGKQVIQFHPNKKIILGANHYVK